MAYDWFEWNGVRCTNYGIHVSRQPEIIRASERATFTSVPGRSGTLTTLEGEDVYDDFILSVECFIMNLSKLTAICGWLRGSGRVTFANRQGGFYYARIVNQISFEPVLQVTLSGNSYITVGGTYFELVGISGTVTVDTPLMETYMNYTSYNASMRGEYPRFLAGNNIVTWSGSVSRIVVTPNWRMV